MSESWDGYGDLYHTDSEVDELISDMLTNYKEVDHKQFIKQPLDASEFLKEEEIKDLGIF